MRARVGALCIAFAALACGGQAVDEEAINSGGSGGAGSSASTSTLNPAGGTAPTCFGIVPTTQPCSNCVAFNLPPVASDANCTFKIPIAAGYRLNPEKLTLYFPGANASRTEIPYVGSKEACATATTYGGWYASNTTGGDSDIGLCPCTCNAARQHEFKADIALDGIPH